MNPFVSQVCFSNDNINKFYLSPYCNITRNEEMMIVERIDIETYIVLERENIEPVLKILQCLKTGLDYSELLKIVNDNLQQEDAIVWINSLFQKGIIE